MKLYGIWQGFIHEGGGCESRLYKTIEAAQDRIFELIIEAIADGMPDNCIWHKIKDDTSIGGWHAAMIEQKDLEKTGKVFEYKTIEIQEFEVMG